ncbi:MAG: aryl-sulfate sulfotransferase [Chloroflexota bacterium]
MQPLLDIKQIEAVKRNDGVILMTVGRNTRSIRKTSEFEAIIAIDRWGKIVWQREMDFCLMDCRQSRQGTLLVMGTSGRAAELSLDGEILREWFCVDRFPDGFNGIPLNTMKLHHTITELSSGLLASLSIEHVPLQSPSAEWTHLMGDTIVIFDRDGKIHNEISLAQILDTKRHTFDSTVPYWRMQGFDKTLDWSHANCLIEDPNDGGYLLSFRHQDAVVKISPDGKLVWILGDPTGWSGKYANKLLQINGGLPFYHQHDLSFTQAGDLMLFDNGTAGAFPPNPRQSIEERESFALCYTIDEAAMTATETWRFGGADLPYSHYVSGVCELPNENRFIACSGIKLDLDGNRVETPPLGVGSIEFFEVTPSKEVVFHAEMADPDAVPEAGWNGFRPEYVQNWPV